MHGGGRLVCHDGSSADLGAAGAQVHAVCGQWGHPQPECTAAAAYHEPEPRLRALKNQRIFLISISPLYSEPSVYWKFCDIDIRRYKSLADCRNFPLPRHHNSVVLKVSPIPRWGTGVQLSFQLHAVLRPYHYWNPRTQDTSFTLDRNCPASSVGLSHTSRPPFTLPLHIPIDWFLN